MPSPSDFRRGFGLEEGMKCGSFTLIKAHVGHEVLVQDDRYCFPSTFHFRTIDGLDATDQQVQELLALLRKHTSGKRIIYSAFGSPYECTITNIAVKARQGAEVIIAATGRRRDIPTKAQEQRANEQQQQAAGIHAAVDMNDPEVKEQLEPYRVIKSRFGSGTCSICGGRIEQGEWIAKRPRGGWSHVACVLALAGQQQRNDEPAGARSEDVTRASRAKQRGEAQHKEEAAEAQPEGGARTSRGKRQGTAQQTHKAAEAKPGGGMRRSRRKREGEVEQEEPSKKQKVERRTATARSTRGGEAAQPGGDTRPSDGKRQADEKEPKARQKQKVWQHAETTQGSRGETTVGQRGGKRTSTATARSTRSKTAQRAKPGTATPRSSRKREAAADKKKAQGQSKKASSNA